MQFLPHYEYTHQSSARTACKVLLLESAMPIGLSEIKQA